MTVEENYSSALPLNKFFNCNTMMINVLTILFTANKILSQTFT